MFRTIFGRLRKQSVPEPVLWSPRPNGPDSVSIPGLTDRDMWWLNGQLKLTGKPTIWFYRPPA